MIAIKTVIMKVKKELFPKLSKLPSGKYYIFFWYEGYRHRFFNANILGENINPNLLEEPEREQTAILLCSRRNLWHWFFMGQPIVWRRW